MALTLEIKAMEDPAIPIVMDGGGAVFIRLILGLLGIMSY